MIYHIKKNSFLLSAFLIFGCSQPKEKPTDTPTSGTITLYADESFFPIVKAEVDAFKNTYNNTEINVQYVTEDEAVMALLNDKTEMIIIGRDLNQKEKDFIKEKKNPVIINKLATDAIAFIVNEAYPDSLITAEQLAKIFKGKIKTWKELSSSLPDQEIEIVVDKSASTNINFLKERLGLNVGKVKIYAAGSNSKVMEYVRGNKICIGVIGGNWISDEDDPQLEMKLDKIKVLAVGKKEAKGPIQFYQPLQANLPHEMYPFTRPIFAINETTKTGLGTGFASYLMSDPGQRVVLKAGILPANMPGREIEITNQ